MQTHRVHLHTSGGTVKLPTSPHSQGKAIAVLIKSEYSGICWYKVTFDRKSRLICLTAVMVFIKKYLTILHIGSRLQRTFKGSGLNSKILVRMRKPSRSGVSFRICSFSQWAFYFLFLIMSTVGCTEAHICFWGLADTSPIFITEGKKGTTWLSHFGHTHLKFMLCTDYTTP